MSIKLEVLHRILPFVSKPGRYVGGELNRIVKAKTNVDVSVVISYPDIYEVGMSNSAIQILYNVINRRNEYSCERVFAPWLDFEKELRKNKIPLYSLESYTPLLEFDILGFSIGYEMLYTNMLNIMDLGFIPVFSKDRDNSHPIIIAGGPGIYNPEPIADFIDVFIYGDGENAILDFIDIYKNYKEFDRLEKLKKFSDLEYCYVPSLYKTIRNNLFVIPEIKRKVKRKVEKDLDNLIYPDSPIVPVVKTVQERITIETTRGCTTGCRFCQAGFIYRPVRERTPLSIDKIVDHAVESTGYDEISLAALSISDYSELFYLIDNLTRKYSEKNISISLPSLRVNSTNIKILNMIQKVRKSGLTFAVESPDEEVRKRINKAVDDNQLFSIIKKVNELGWRLIKLYFMIGLPFAQDEELKIEEFIKRLINHVKKININVNVSLFVPKPHTPFERVKQLDLEEAKKILRYLRNSFSRTRVKIKYQNPEMSRIEAILSRGDRDIGELIYNVFIKGERFSSWDEVFNYELWIGEADFLNLNVDKYLKNIDFDIKLPWDFIDTGVTKKYLLEEYKRAEKEETTVNCIYDKCPGCGVCNKEIKNILAVDKIHLKKDEYNKNLSEENVGSRNILKNKSRKTKIICEFQKRGIYKYFSHLDMMNLFARIGRMANLPLNYTEGFNPKPRINIPFPLPLGVESESELMEITLNSEMLPEEVIKKINLILPEDLMILKAKIVNGSKSIASKMYCHDYLIKTDDIILIVANLNRDLIKKRNLKENNVLNGFDYFEKGIIIRLFGNMSLKRIFNDENLPEIFSRTKRIKIWKVLDNKIVPFV